MNAYMQPTIAQGTPHTTIGAVCNAIRSMRMPGHHDYSTVIAVLAASVKANGAMTDKCRTSIVDQLDEMADEIDQDLVNQRAEE